MTEQDSTMTQSETITQWIDPLTCEGLSINHHKTVLFTTL